MWPLTDQFIREVLIKWMVLDGCKRNQMKPAHEMLKLVMVLLL